MRYRLNKSALDRPSDRVSSRSRAYERAQALAGAGPEVTRADLDRFERGEVVLVFVAQRYRIERLIGRGGMASVYAAFDTRLGRHVAIKVLAQTYDHRPKVLARFLREGRVTSRLEHPNIVRVLNFGITRNSIIYIAMELLDGEDLRVLLARERTLTWPRVQALMLQVCGGLGVAHRAGVAHLDLKPSNCFRIVRKGREQVSLVDFGIATAFRRDTEDGPAATQGVDQQIAPRERYVVAGTPAYMAPEQGAGLDPDHRSDIYSLGVILGEMLTGRLPFAARSTLAMLNAHAHDPAPSLVDLAPAGVQIPLAVAAIYTRALSKDPAARYPNVEAFAAALRAVPRRHAVLARLRSVRARLRGRVRGGFEFRATVSNLAPTGAEPPREHNTLRYLAGPGQPANQEPNDDKRQQ